MATALGKISRSRSCKLAQTLVRVLKINCSCTHPLLGYRSYVVSTSLIHKTSSVQIRSPIVGVSGQLPIIIPCRHLTVDDKLTPIDSQYTESALANPELGGWSPVGIVEQALDWLHISAGLPWWGSIAVATLVARTVMFPLFVAAQRNAVTMNNNLPQMQVLQLKITEARKNGDTMEAQRLSKELLIFMTEKNCNPLRSMLAPLAQAPVFISFFFALRQMANLPVESFKYGGALWFYDLTLTDPYYLLPVITSLTLFITIELNAAGNRNTPATKTVQYVMRALPVVMFPFVMCFPAAILCYWVTSNGVTLMQIGLLKFPKVRELLNIPERINFTQESFPAKARKGFMEGFREAVQNSQITRELQSREQTEQMKIRKAGEKPVAKGQTDSENTKDS